MYAAVKAGREGLLISNDEMRDHIFQLLAPKFFYKWKQARPRVSLEVPTACEMVLLYYRYDALRVCNRLSSRRCIVSDLCPS